MFANLADAQFQAGMWRWRPTMRRCQRLRRRYVRRGNRRARRHHWERAYAWWDWAIVGYDDSLDFEAQTKAAIARRQYGEFEEAEEIWHTVLARSEYARVIRLEVSQQFALLQGVPGDDDNTPSGS